MEITLAENWNHPKITVDYDRPGLPHVKMDLLDFAAALRQEIGSVSMTMTKAGFDKQFDTAVQRVLLVLTDAAAKAEE